MGLYSSDPPDAPNIAGANEAGVWADAETLGIRKLIANAAKFGKSIDVKVPIFDSEGNKTGFKDVTYDFKGYSDADATREEMEFGAEAADFMTKAMLDVQQKYGKDFVKQRIEELKAADPTGYEVREMLGESAKADLERGTELSPDMARQVTQQERAAQAARGNIYGSAPAAAEAMTLGDAGFRMRQQRLANAASFLSGSTPVAQFGQISGAQQGASPFNPMGIQSGISVNPNAGAQGQQWAMNSYNTQMNYAAQQQPIGAQLLGMATGVASGKISDKLLSCHVAREVFGADNPEWLMFYDWKELKAPGWFRKLYNKFSVQVAKFISDKPKLKNIIRGWMRSKI
jgi:hypothetical protein|tara:strand:+ start:679 stop:1710 length:1032 start_codon:yes stop_codon:yes gene_type:complete